jgi:hypothetical protein
MYYFEKIVHILINQFCLQTSLDLERFSKGTFHNDWKSKLEYFTEAYRLVVDNANGLGIDSAIQQKLRE